MSTTTDTTNPPTQADRQTGESNSVLVRLSISTHPAIKEPHWPGQNRVGTALLARLLEVRLRASGITVQPPQFLGELNASFYLFPASPVVDAVRVIKEELAHLGLLQHSQMAWFDPSEQANRVIYPGGAQFVPLSQDQIEAEKATIAEARRHNDALLAELLHIQGSRT